MGLFCGLSGHCQDCRRQRRRMHAAFCDQPERKIFGCINRTLSMRGQRVPTQAPGCPPAIARRPMAVSMTTPEQGLWIARRPRPVVHKVKLLNIGELAESPRSTGSSIAITGRRTWSADSTCLGTQCEAWACGPMTTTSCAD